MENSNIFFKKTAYRFIVRGELEKNGEKQRYKLENKSGENNVINE